MEDVKGSTFSGLSDFVVNIHFCPVSSEERFFLDEICFHGEACAGQIKGVSITFVLRHFAISCK